jgi:hypothetical protein
MERLNRQVVPALAVILIGVAAFTARWVSQTEMDGRLAVRSVASRREVGDGATTYRFLVRGERGAVNGRLTLGRFIGGELQAHPTWAFTGVGQWHSWAPSIFEREAGWSTDAQPGYRISRWLSSDGPATFDREHLFWSLQALRFLDPESLAHEIDWIERSSAAVRICITEEMSDYDYDSNTLYWNPVADRFRPVDGRLDRRWFQTDALITLAHQLHHLWHDLCCQGDSADPGERERLAVTAENRLRHLLFLKDPTRSNIYPRPGVAGSCSDLPGESPWEAWGNYTGRVR